MAHVVSPTATGSAAPASCRDGGGQWGVCEGANRVTYQWGGEGKQQGNHQYDISAEEIWSH